MLPTSALKTMRLQSSGVSPAPHRLIASAKCRYERRGSPRTAEGASCSTACALAKSRRCGQAGWPPRSNRSIMNTWWAPCVRNAICGTVSPALPASDMATNSRAGIHGKSPRSCIFTSHNLPSCSNVALGRSPPALVPASPLTRRMGQVFRQVEEPRRRLVYQLTGLNGHAAAGQPDPHRNSAGHASVLCARQRAAGIRCDLGVALE